MNFVKVWENSKSLFNAWGFGFENCQSPVTEDLLSSITPYIFNMQPLFKRNSLKIAQIALNTLGYFPCTSKYIGNLRYSISFDVLKTFIAYNIVSSVNSVNSAMNPSYAAYTGVLALSGIFPKIASCAAMALSHTVRGYLEKNNSSWGKVINLTLDATISTITTILCADESYCT